MVVVVVVVVVVVIVVISAAIALTGTQPIPYWGSSQE